jgi:hypothetical protein
VEDTDESAASLLPLSTAEEGRSDLSLELSGIPMKEGTRFEIDDLHVL